MLFLRLTWVMGQCGIGKYYFSFPAFLVFMPWEVESPYGEQVHWRLVDLPTGGCQPLSQGSEAAIWSQLGISLLGKA